MYKKVNPCGRMCESLKWGVASLFEVQTLKATRQLRCGANLRGGNCKFRVWAPNAKSIKLKLIRSSGGEEHISMNRNDDGYFSATREAEAGDLYSYIVDEQFAVPDPVSRLLPQGVHGPTEIVDPETFAWHDNGWRGIPLEKYILYELHVGTFSEKGTFGGVIDKLEYLKNDLGISAIELMPVAAFPGTRNWGYDGVSLYAVQASYGGPDGLKRLVDAAHKIGLAVVLDVVYNHLGNEGNYLRMFAPYFTDRHKTPWGEAVNYDSPGCEGVREFVVDNALYWLQEYHIDGLRLDAVQTIHDDSRKHILTEIKESAAEFAREAGRKICVIAESDENDSKLVTEYGLDGFWSDDFHHAVHTLLTRENKGYYQDFGTLEQLAKALNDGYVFQGEYFNYWKSPRGTNAKEVSLPANVICIQNHDQVGNRAKGERLSVLSSFVQRQAAAALLLLAPHTPLIFMGQEFDEVAPFQFFTSFGDQELIEAVRNGRRNEFKDFAWEYVPDPQDPGTFERSRINWHLVAGENRMLDWYRTLIGLRKRFVTAASIRRCRAKMIEKNLIHMEIPASQSKLLVIANLGGSEITAPDASWQMLLSAADETAAIGVFHRP